MPVLPPPSLKAPSVERKISRARWTLAWEALWPRAIPVLGFVALFFAAAHLNLFAGLPPWPHVGLLAALVLAFAGVSWWSFRGFAWPDAIAAERRLERDGGVTHRPLMAVDDTLALGSGDSLSAALFEAHRRREAARLAALKVNAPSPGMTARDPSAWRFVPMFLLVAAVGVAGGWSWDRVETAVTPAFPPPPPVTVDLWLAPPAYTRRAPIYLDAKEPGKVVRAPVGSKLTGFVDGVRGKTPPSLKIGDKEIAFSAVGEGRYQIDTTVEAGDKLAVVARGREQAAWGLRLTPDLPPTVDFAKTPSATDKGAMRIDYVAGDDFGVTAVSAQIRLHGSAFTGVLSADDEPEVLKIDLPMPAGSPVKAEDGVFQDLTAHPWAGLPVTIRLYAVDALGQTARSSMVRTTLPERRFSHPVARALIVLRKALTQDPEGNRNPVAQGMFQLNSRPQAFKDDVVVIMALRAGARRLTDQKEPDPIPEIQRLMWDVALRIEQGSMYTAENDLRQIQQELQDALNRQAPDEEIERLIQALREALDRYMRELAERMKDPEERERMRQQQGQMDPNRTMTGEDLQKMIDRAREMARSGAREQAKELLNRLREMIENMQPMLGENGQPQQGQPGQQGQQGQQGRDQMNQLDRMAREQNRLLNESQRQQRGLQGQQGQPGQRGQPGQQGQPGDEPGQGGPGQADRQRQQQERLRNQLGQMQDRMQRGGQQAPEAFGDAGRAMREAEEALRNGQWRDAARAQRRALDNLQKGLGDLAEQMRRENGPGNGQDRADVEENRDRLDDKDPLGRDDAITGNQGYSDNGEQKVPGQMQMQRSREILEELRRRASEPSRPKPELDYIDRLLKRF